MREPYAVLSQKSNSGRHTKKKNLNHFLINGLFLPSHRNLTFPGSVENVSAICNSLLPGPGKKYLQWQSHMNQLTFVFNATVIAITGKINPEARIQMLSPKNMSCRNFPTEGKNSKILLTGDVTFKFHL